MANKEASVAELTNLFESSTAVLLTEYRGLTVAQLKTLRKSISEDASYAVVKNTLTKIAANNAGISSFDDELAGPSAIAFVHGDPVAVAKALRDFAKANPLLVVKGGYFDGKPLTADRGRQARRPRVPRSAAGEARRCLQGLAVRSRISVQRTAVEGRSHGRRAA